MLEDSINNELHTQIQYCLLEKLTESEQRYRKLVENLREIVFECDRRGCLTFVNHAWTETLGYPVVDVTGKRLQDFIVSGDNESLHLALQNQSNCKLELRFLHQSGNILWLELAIRLSHNQKLSGSLINVTERKQAAALLKQTNEELEARVKQRTSELIQTNQELTVTLQELQQTQGQLIQNEKMSSLGQLVAGIAHEINNPVNFIHGNLAHVRNYTQNLLGLIAIYQHHYPNPVHEVQAEAEAIELKFIQDDLSKVIASMEKGSYRIREIVHSLRNFSRLDEAEIKTIDIHEGLDSTLVILAHRLRTSAEKPAIHIIKDYASLPEVECYAGLLNQVFMNILANAIDVLEAAAEKQTPDERATNPGQITLQTSLIDEQWVKIQISDNGAGMSPEIQCRIFDPFFTTKPIGKGTGMGMSISHQIVTERHKGKLECFSAPEKGTEFMIQIPLKFAQTVP